MFLIDSHVKNSGRNYWYARFWEKLLNFLHGVKASEFWTCRRKSIIKIPRLQTFLKFDSHACTIFLNWRIDPLLIIMWFWNVGNLSWYFYFFIMESKINLLFFFICLKILLPFDQFHQHSTRWTMNTTRSECQLGFRTFFNGKPL